MISFKDLGLYELEDLNDSWEYNSKIGRKVTKSDLETTLKKLTKDKGFEARLDVLREERLLSDLIATELLHQIYGDIIIEHTIEQEGFGIYLSEVEKPLKTFPELASMNFDQYLSLHLAFYNSGTEWSSCSEEVEEFFKEYRINNRDLIDKKLTYPGVIHFFASDKKRKQDLLRLLKKASGSEDFMERIDKYMIGWLKKEFVNTYESNTVRDLISQEGNIKDMVYKNSVHVIQSAHDKGIIFEPYVNLTDSSIVYQAVVNLREKKKFRGKSLYQSMVTSLREKHNLELSKLTEEDVKIYSDEIALEFRDALSKSKGINGDFQSLEQNIQETMQDDEVSYQLASRDTQDLKLGNKCGDCTQKGAMNEDKIDGWFADINTQFLKISYNDKFIGRFNLVLVEANEKPAILIDAIEFVPQARENDSYSKRAKVAFEKGLDKVKQIATNMNVRQVLAYTFSNSSGVPEYLESLGYSSDQFNIKLRNTKDLSEVVGLSKPIEYFLQSGGKEKGLFTPKELSTFESYLNEDYFTSEERKEEVKELIDSDNFDMAAQKISSQDRQKVSDIFNLNRIVRANEQYNYIERFESEMETLFENYKLRCISEALENLYGKRKSVMFGTQLYSIMNDSISD